MKELSIGYGTIDRHDWESIKKQIEKDIRIASEECIKLAGGPYPLDPWLVAFEEDEPVVYLVDIGSYTSVNVSDSVDEHIARFEERILALESR